MNYIDTCPHCGTNLVGEKIAEKSRHLYGGATHGCRLIGISNGDSVMYYECPDCRKRIDRSDAEKRRPSGFRTVNIEVKR